ncbi:MAG: hypothetical protein ABI665_20920 [Vicinamibacterales bacterium]
MTWRDKLEIGLKNDAPFRKDNLPEDQVRGPEIPAGPGRSPVIPAAIADETIVPSVQPGKKPVEPTPPESDQADS